ncbi:hypothetical protein [Croceibacterium aestuarii]|uniref:hypothetical protein n=1 Tax=Croceibacterium aestuarii TaxID=3064139 RepID=UPI00272E2728|nr:hypothetical protein [Croceibacterium sp. D39]
MPAPIIRAEKYHGTAELGLSRYLVMYIAQIGWVLLGVYLLRNAYWPSTCTPKGFAEVYACSMRLPETRHWIEAALLTWLWSTPILVALDIIRRYRAWAEKRADRALPIKPRRD